MFPKIDWVRKLSSRKFWALVAGFATSTLVLFNVGEDATVKIVALITSMGAVVGYMLSEAYVDGKREEGDHYWFDDEDDDWDFDEEFIEIE